MALLTCVYALTKKGKAVELATLEANKYNDHKNLIRKIRDAGGQHDGQQFDMAYLFSSRRHPQRFKFNPQYPEFVKQSIEAGKAPPEEVEEESENGQQTVSEVQAQPEGKKAKGKKAK